MAFYLFVDLVMMLDLMVDFLWSADGHGRYEEKREPWVVVVDWRQDSGVE